MISITPFGQTGPVQPSGTATTSTPSTSPARAAATAGDPAKSPLEHGTFAADFYGAVAGAAWGLAARVRPRPRRRRPARRRVVRRSDRRRLRRRAEHRRLSRRTGGSTGAPASACRSAPRRRFCRARTATSGCSRSRPASGTALRDVMGNPEWAQIEMFQDMFVRAQNADAIYPLIERVDDGARQAGDHGSLPGGGLPGHGRVHRRQRRPSTRT